MPFRSFSGLTNVARLDAQVVRFAPYGRGGVCAGFTTDPVVVASVPLAGGKPSVQGVGVASCADGALIDERVALVMAGDELWGVFDLQHKPKVDPVLGSVRALFHNAGAPSALALGWNGEGYELTLTGHEVVAREFQVRGEIRTASLDGVNCYVVADDGAGGGKFREHAGNTPESGTSVRCDLPLAARAMTRLAGGAQLSALTASGADAVCVVRKVGGASVEAKMVGVLGGVVDVAVLETALFVLSADNVVRMYSGDSLSRAGDGGQATPTAELSLGTDGAPTAIATTSKGANRVWIGTREGEVVRCDAVKGASLL